MNGKCLSDCVSVRKKTPNTLTQVNALKPRLSNKDAKPELKWKLGPASSQLYFRKKEVHMIQCLFQPDSHPRMADSCLAKGV